MASLLPLLLVLAQPILGQWVAQAPALAPNFDVAMLNFDQTAGLDQGIGLGALPLAEQANAGLLSQSTIDQLRNPRLKAFKTLVSADAAPASDCIKLNTAAASGFVLADSKDVASAVECQQICQKMEECLFFEWVGAENKDDVHRTCTMFNESGRETEAAEGMSHGPRNCKV